MIVFQDLHRQLLNLQSDGGSHDSHNDSGYSTRFGASAGPSPSLSGNNHVFVSFCLSLFLWFCNLILSPFLFLS